MAQTGSSERSALSSFWQGHLETETLTFDAYGASQMEAEASLVRATKRHCRQYMVDWYRFFVRYWGEVEYQEIRFGSGWRDGVEIWRGLPEDEVEEAMLMGRRQEYTGPI